MFLLQRSVPALCLHCVRSYSSTSSASAQPRLIYTTPNALLVKLAKVFSLSTLGITSVSTPVLFYFWENPAVQALDLSPYMFGGALVASACSTGALHYLLSPFIHSIYLHQPSKGIISPNTKITLETLNIAAQKRRTTVALRDLVPSSRSLLTWTVSKKALNPNLQQTRFWLDTRNGVGDQEAMSSIVQIIKDGRQRTRVI